MCFLILDLVQTNPKNGRVKALSKTCLDRTYFVWNSLLCVGFLFCTSMFAEEIKLSFPKPAEGEASSIYVNGHLMYICNNQNWDKNTKRSWIKFHLNEDKGSKVTFEKEVDGGFEWYATTPAKEKAKDYDGRRAAFFFNLESFVFYEDGNKFIIEIQ